MLATQTRTGMDLFLPPMVRFHELPAHMETARLNYAPALSFHQQATAQQALDALRQMQPDVDDVYYLFVTDSQERLVGVVTLHELICAAPGARLFEFMDQRQITLPADASLAEQAHLMSDSGLLALPVVDEKGRLVGAMDASDVIRAMEYESTAGMYHLAGLSENETTEQADINNAGYRLVWLVCNLVIAFGLAWIISGFASMIARTALLVVFIPVAVRLAGQAGTQSLTFMVRSLALGQVHTGNQRQVMHREAIHGLINGLLLGGLAGLLGGLWQGSLVLGLIIGTAVFVNLLLAALAGAGVPLLLKALRLNPGHSSTLAVTTLTDMCGLGLLLGLAALALHSGYL